MHKTFFARLTFIPLCMLLLCVPVLPAQASEDILTAIKNLEINIDLDNNGTPDINIDTDNDGIADINIDLNGDNNPELNVDIDQDLIPDLDIDIDGDGLADLNIDKDHDRFPDTNIDSDFNGKPDIWFTEGTNAHFYPDSNDGLVFAADGAFSDFQGLKINGIPLTDDDFAALEGDDSGINEGDTIAEVFSSCLRKLSPGRHILTFVYEGEEVSCYFTVLEKNLVTAATADAGSFLFGLVIFLGIALILTLFIIYKVVMRKVFHPKH